MKFFSRIYIVLLVVFLAVIGCTRSHRLADEAVTTQAQGRFDIEQHSFHYSDEYGGWDFVVSYLINDGIPKKLLHKVYGSGQVVPPFDFVPFKLRPQETHGMYAGFRTAAMRAQYEACYTQYQPIFNAAARRFEVSPRLLTAILFIESRCGKLTGNNLVVNRLSRIVATGDPNNLKKNLAQFQRDDASVKERDAVERGQYLFDTFYPQLLALFQEHLKGHLNLFELKGSIAGAFGWTQFLPKTYQDFGFDGNGNGSITLHEAADAIYSTARFFHDHGWSNSLSRKEKRHVIWQYNRSDPYIETVLFYMGEV